MKLAGKGYATACVEYRLAGEATFPAAIYDVKAAARWVRANASRYGLDPDRVGIAGASAGGKLAALVALTNGDPRYEGGANHLDKSSDLKCLVVMDGQVDGRVNGVWLNDSEDTQLIRETTPYYKVVNSTTVLPSMLFVNDGDKICEWIGANRCDVVVKQIKTSLPHAYELLDGEQDTVIGWLDEFLKRQL
jgi:pimeloyl-ACP methyl ester carboxylesterase